MNTDIYIKGIFAAIFSFGFAWVVFSRYDDETGLEKTGSGRQRCLPYVPGVLPLLILCLTVLGLVLYGAGPTARMTLSLCFGIFLHISLYYAVLMLLLPLLRRYISARACAMLWLIPNYLYITQLSYMKVPEPLLVIRASGSWVWALFGIWLAGFAAVLLWKTGSHLWFRRQVLRGAYPVTDRAALELWDQAVNAVGIKKPKFRLAVSPNVQSPLTVGLFRRSLITLLPERAYSQEELKLIFSHETVHIGREDSWSKFFLMFCTAMCWFNPLMWIAMRKSADDLELSCDETVLLGADAQVRRQYAGLLLSAAGDERGFTTCLSAAAASMRYRLKSVVDPRGRRSGAIIVGLIFFVLCMTCGYVALAYEGGAGEAVLFQYQDHGRFQLRDIFLRDDEFRRTYICTDENAFYDYLAGLEMDCLTGNYSFSENDREFTYLLDTPQGTILITLSDHAIKVVPLYGEAPSASYYYLPRGVDWNRLDTLIIASPALEVHLTGDGDAYGTNFPAMLDRLTVVESRGETVLYESGIPEGEVTAGVFGYDPSKAAFVFSCTLAGPFTIEVENWDLTSGYTIAQDELRTPFTVPLPSYPAHYRVRGDFLGDGGKIYRAEFRFEIGAQDG